MPLRPARTCRGRKGPAYTRYSKKKPRKSYVKAMPHLALNITAMGNASGYYTHKVDLVAKDKVQIRDNALEAGRIAVNKILEGNIPGEYFFFIRVIPHHIIREKKLVYGVHADKISTGMAHAFGRPSDRAARVSPGKIVFTTRVKKRHVPLVKKAYKIAKVKLPGNYSIKIIGEEVGEKPEE